MAFLVYDADCGFCTRCALWISRRGVEVKPWQALALAPLGLTEDMVAAAAYRVDPSAGVCDAGELAIARSLEASVGWRRIAGRLIRTSLVRPLAARVYRWVAAHRHRLPRGNTYIRPTRG